jgi:hypothetical protein
MANLTLIDEGTANGRAARRQIIDFATHRSHCRDHVKPLFTVITNSRIPLTFVNRINCAAIPRP